jgi:glycosyltransferase involved in cell wall biosynthesis
MKIGWIFPQKKMCGISFYSHKYVQTLNKYGDIVCIDPVDFLTNRIETIRILRQCGLVHIQYETAFFLGKSRDFYFDLCASIRCPIIVTIHEVYDRFPGVYPRESITGIYPLRLLKRRLYDFRHPYPTALTKHTSQGFRGRALCVHSLFQKELLLNKNPRLPAISVLPVPIGLPASAPAPSWDGHSTLCLTATGFISDSIDYNLLIATLALCEMPWKFTWIGTVRRPDDNQLLDTLREEIGRRGWVERFIITGAVSEEQRDALLGEAHIYCAFFKYKSSSESLATAIAARSMIVATSLPLTREMIAEFPLMVIAPSDSNEMAKALSRLATDKSLRESLDTALTAYSMKYSRERMAKHLNELYEQVIRK